MKKLISAVAAGALFFSVAGSAFAEIIQDNVGTTTVVSSTASSNTGFNTQVGGSPFSITTLTTGNANSNSEVLSVANQNGEGSGVGDIIQDNVGTTTVVVSSASSNTGFNTQVGGSPFTVTSHTTGNAESNSSVASWANINLSGISLSI